MRVLALDMAQMRSSGGDAQQVEEEDEDEGMVDWVRSVIFQGQSSNT